MQEVQTKSCDRGQCSALPTRPSRSVVRCVTGEVCILYMPATAAERLLLEPEADQSIDMRAG